MLALASYSASLYAEEPKKKNLSASVPNKAFLHYLAELKEVKGELLSPIDMLESERQIVSPDKDDLAVKPNDKKLELAQTPPPTNNKKSQKIELKEDQ